MPSQEDRSMVLAAGALSRTVETNGIQRTILPVIPAQARWCIHS